MLKKVGTWCAWIWWFSKHQTSSFPMDLNLILRKVEGETWRTSNWKPRHVHKIDLVIIYLTNTRPSLVFSSCISIYRSSKTHLSSVVQLLRYIKGTVGRGLFFLSYSSLHLKCFAIQIGQAAWHTSICHKLLYIP